MEYGHEPRWNGTGSHNGTNKHERIHSPYLIHIVRKTSISYRSRGYPPKSTRGRVHLSKPSIVAPSWEFVTSTRFPHRPLRQPYAFREMDLPRADPYHPPSHTAVFRSTSLLRRTPRNFSKRSGQCAPAKRTRVLRHHRSPQWDFLCHRPLHTTPVLCSGRLCSLPQSAH